MPSPRPPRSRPLLRALAFGLFFTAACGQPPEVREHVRRGEAALEAGRYGQALAAFVRVRELAPTDPALQRAVMRARIHLVAAEPGRITPDMLDEARYEAEALIETDPGRKAVYLTALAQLALRGGNADEAKAKLDEAIKADPQSALAHTALGLLLLGRKETQAQAKTELAAALAAKPEHAPALIAMAQIKAQEGDFSGAAEKLQAALKVRDDLTARLALGGIYTQQQRAAEAVEQLQRAVQLDPKSAEALAALGQALLAAGRPAEAERALRSALEARPDEAAATALGFALLRQKKADLALEMFEKVLARDPAQGPAHYGAGLAAEEQGKNDAALVQYRAVLALAGGEGRQGLAEMARDASMRIAALQAAAAAPSGSAAAGTPPGPTGASPGPTGAAPRPPPGKPPEGEDVLGKRR